MVLIFAFVKFLLTVFPDMYNSSASGTTGLILTFNLVQFYLTHQSHIGQLKPMFVRIEPLCDMMNWE